MRLVFDSILCFVVRADSIRQGSTTDNGAHLKLPTQPTSVQYPAHYQVPSATQSISVQCSKIQFQCSFMQRALTRGDSSPHSGHPHHIGSSPDFSHNPLQPHIWSYLLQPPTISLTFHAFQPQLPNISKFKVGSYIVS